MSNICHYAPYVFLEKKSDKTYFLYIAILHYEGQNIIKSVDNNPNYLIGTTFLNYQIEGPERNEECSTRYYFKTLEILDPVKAYDDFDPNTYSIQIITVFRGKGEQNKLLELKRSTTIFYCDADKGNEVNTGEIALNCPYFYLNNPIGEVGEGKGYFHPSCLLFVKNYKVETAYTHFREDSVGVFKQCIGLVEEESSDAIRMVDPAKIPANSRKYKDADRITGYFATQIKQLSKSKKAPKRIRKGRLRNSSADGNSTSFIDSISFFDEIISS